MSTVNEGLVKDPGQLRKSFDWLQLYGNPENLTDFDNNEFKSFFKSILFAALLTIEIAKKQERESLNKQVTAIVNFIKQIKKELKNDFDDKKIKNQNKLRKLKLAVEGYLIGAKNELDLSFLQLNDQQTTALTTFLTKENDNPKHSYKTRDLAVDQDAKIIKSAALWLKEYNRRVAENPQDFPLADEDVYYKMTHPNLYVQYSIDKTSEESNCFLGIHTKLTDQELDALSIAVSNSIHELNEPATEELVTQSTGTLSYIWQCFKQACSWLSKRSKRFKRFNKMDALDIGSVQGEVVVRRNTFACLGLPAGSNLSVKKIGEIEAQNGRDKEEENIQIPLEYYKYFVARGRKGSNDSKEKIEKDCQVSTEDAKAYVKKNYATTTRYQKDIDKELFISFVEVGYENNQNISQNGEDLSETRVKLAWKSQPQQPQQPRRSEPRNTRPRLSGSG